MDKSLFTLPLRQQRMGSGSGGQNGIKIASSSAIQQFHSASSGGWRTDPIHLDVWDQPTMRLQTIASQVRNQEAVPANERAAQWRQLLRAWLYRSWLLVTTLLLTWLLLQFQSVLDRAPVHPSVEQVGVQWAELIWLAPVPLAIALWSGWIIFAEAVHPGPAPMEVPFVTARHGLVAFVTPKPTRLVFRFVTRGDNVEVLRNSVQAVHQAFRHYPLVPGPYLIEVISESPLLLGTAENERTRVYVVPSDYVTPNRSRFKARALAYIQQAVHPLREDWYIYLDEESLIDESMVAGIYRFVERALRLETSSATDGRKRQPAGLIGQGAILYEGGDWFFRGADALRTADDLGRFRLQYAIGMPLFGVHGSYLVLRGTDDARLSFDVGPANSITEDAAWSLRAWSKGFRFEWVEGYLHEQPPQGIMDFVKQRSRWLSGIRLVLRDTEIPLRYRFCLGLFTVLWQLAFLPFLVAVIALFVHASPFAWMRLPSDFAWATFVLAYFQGIDVQVTHAQRSARK
ncbi:MAG: glycosyltransferase family 2 protein, partial [Chloroflexota bacterium]|nr:glycosyltransferase family 2 protein [Chloroflexota bacterium]